MFIILIYPNPHNNKQHILTQIRKVYTYTPIVS